LGTAEILADSRAREFAAGARVIHRCDVEQTRGNHRGQALQAPLIVETDEVIRLTLIWLCLMYRYRSNKK